MWVAYSHRLEEKAPQIVTEEKDIYKVEYLAQSEVCLDFSGK
jgi:hypothetical protein